MDFSGMMLGIFFGFDIHYFMVRNSFMLSMKESELVLKRSCTKLSLVGKVTV